MRADGSPLITALSPDRQALSYLIAGTPRTGSTLLCSLLRSTGVAGHPESYFRQPDEPMWARRWRLATDANGSFDYRDYVRAAIAAGRTGNGVFGARVMWGTLDELVTKLEAVHPHLGGRDLDVLTAAFGPLRFCSLRRDDTVAQAVSWARAEQTRYWHAGDEVVREPTFDFDQVDGLVRTIGEHNAAWRTWFSASGIWPYEVTYEQLVADPPGVVGGVLAFLGLAHSGTPAIEPDHRRQADDLNADWIERYRASSAR
jgi:LPS sulfotransferase NodH